MGPGVTFFLQDESRVLPKGHANRMPPAVHLRGPFYHTVHAVDLAAILSHHSRCICECNTEDSPDQPRPFRAKRGQLERFYGPYDFKPRPEPGLDSLTCARFARQRPWNERRHCVRELLHMKPTVEEASPLCHLTGGTCAS